MAILGDIKRYWAISGDIGRYWVILGNIECDIIWVLARNTDNHS